MQINEDLELSWDDFDQNSKLRLKEFFILTSLAVTELVKFHVLTWDFRPFFFNLSKKDFSDRHKNLIKDLSFGTFTTKKLPNQRPPSHPCK